MPEPDELEHRTLHPVVPHEKFPEGHAIGTPAGWCAPADYLGMPDIHVARGGPKYPTGEEAAAIRDYQRAADARRERRERHKREVGARNARHRERMRTVRVIAIWLAIAYLLTMINQSLPWQ